VITIIKIGRYKLVETKENTKLLYLDDQSYAWIMPKEIGEILVATHREHRFDTTLGTGQYYLYDVDDESTLTDLQHLELQVGAQVWQGYLLPTGIPTGTKKRSRIISTNQQITCNPLYRDNLVLRPTVSPKTPKVQPVGGRSYHE
jgi:hypothetical protein